MIIESIVEQQPKKEPDFTTWSKRLVKEGQVLWHRLGWPGVEKHLAAALKQAYEQGGNE